MGTSKNRRKKPSKGKHHRRAMPRLPQADGRSLDLLRSLVDRRAELPLGPCYIVPGWEKEGSIIPLCLTRVLSADKYLATVFLIDLACLGIKDVYAVKILGAELDRIVNGYPKPLVKCEPALAMKIIATAADYAAGLGLEPPPVYEAVKQLFADVDPAGCTESIWTGVKGTPCYNVGPDDDVDAIVARLTEKLGPDGFDMVHPLDPTSGV
jgi:hypothetical protein